MNDLSFARPRRAQSAAGVAPPPTELPSAPDDFVAAGLAAEQSLRPADGADFLPALAAGVVALAPNVHGWRYALSPSPHTLRLARRHGLAARGDVVRMTRGGYRAMLRRHAARDIADRAAHDLGRRMPGLSAAAPATAAQRFALGVIAVLFLASLVAAPVWALAVTAALMLPVFVALVLLRCGAAIEAWRLAPTPSLRLPDDALPHYTVLAPLCREAAVVPQFVAALSRLDYPPARLEIKFLVEADDDATRAALELQRLPEHMEIVIVPDGLPRTKPRALNAGLLEARGALVTIYDAEDRPDPRQLRTAANLFARLPSEVACLQGRLVIDNVDDSWLTRMFALEYAGLFDIVNAGLTQARLPVLLGGTSNHFRADALRAAGGWDAFNVTEDADLAFRLARSGFAVADLPSATLEEAPARFGAWRRQRTRWMKGFMLTLITHTRRPGRLMREAGPVGGLTLLALCGGTVLSALCYPVFLLITGLTLAVWGVPTAETVAGALLIGAWVVLFVAGLAAIYLPVVLGAMRRGLADLWAWILLKPLYCCLISLAAWAAVLELFTARTRWNKTDHGFARTSRAGGDVRPAPRSGPRP